MANGVCLQIIMEFSNVLISVLVQDMSRKSIKDMGYAVIRRNREDVYDTVISRAAQLASLEKDTCHSIDDVTTWTRQ